MTKSVMAMQVIWLFASSARPSLGRRPLPCPSTSTEPSAWGGDVFGGPDFGFDGSGLRRLGRDALAKRGQSQFCEPINRKFVSEPLGRRRGRRAEHDLQPCAAESIYRPVEPSAGKLSARWLVVGPGAIRTQVMSSSRIRVRPRGPPPGNNCEASVGLKPALLLRALRPGTPAG